MSLFDKVRAFFSPSSAGSELFIGEAVAARREGASSRLLAEAAPPPEEETSTELPQIKRLASAGKNGGPSVQEAILLLRRVRGTVHESAAVTLLLREMERRIIPEPLRVACADILAARGDEQGALRVLDGANSPAGLLLSADLLASSGQLARAVGTIERVLARDLNAPGARERHQRWIVALGYPRREPKRLDEATMIAPREPGGPFHLLREVARGGSGVIYEAEDRVLGRRIAFKLYHGRGADRAVIEREARTAAHLFGPGILRVFDADPALGWIALEWVPRGSVRDVLGTGELSPLIPIARWARPLARALARVHAAGLVHADVKPANILLRQPQDPVLGDFGLACPIGALGNGGSPGYVSPERLAGRQGHPRDDVYGYGRVVEDVIHKLEETGGAGEDADAWRALAMKCIGPDDQRAEDGSELVRRMP